MDPDYKLLEARFFLNMNRVSTLVALGAPPSSATVSDPAQSDISRAAVVFLHATFEDLLRTAARQRPDAMTSDYLNKIPLSGASGRAEKFHLGALRAHRGKTVDALLRESVEAHWRHVAFSSCDDVENVLRQMGIGTEPFKFLYPGLDSMMKRRHQIVHDADLQNPTDRDARPWLLGDNILLFYWLLHVLTFFAQLHVSVDPESDIQGWYLIRLTKAIDRAREMIRDLLKLLQGPKESLAEGFGVMSRQLMEVKTLLGPPSDDEMREIARKMEIEASVPQNGEDSSATDTPAAPPAASPRTPR